MIACATSFAQTWTQPISGSPANYGDMRFGTTSPSSGLNYSIRTPAGGGWAWRFTDMNNVSYLSLDYAGGFLTVNNPNTTHNAITQIKLTGPAYGNNGLNLFFFGQNDVDSNPEWSYGGGAGSAAVVNVQNKSLTFGTNNLGRMMITANGNVGIGTYNPGTFKLAVEGKIGAREVNVTTTTPWPDYVFENDYQLPQLEVIESFVNENHHLPGIPDACDIETNGVNLGEMNGLLLKKIEELTLYVIDQNKMIKEQNERISQLEKSVKK